MELLSALLCDSAADYGAKLCILGAFDTIMARGFPVVHPHCSLAVRILFSDTDEGKHRLSIKLIDSDGKNLLPPIEPELLVRLPENMFFVSQNLVLNLQGLRFEKPGQYSIDIGYDNRIVARVPLQVLEIKADPPGV
jgi:hypothetical protein